MTTLSFSDNVVRKEKNMNLETKARQRLAVIYKDDGKISEAWDKISRQLQKYQPAEEKGKKLTQRDSILITYGDTITKKGEPGLQVLHKFLEDFVGDAVTNVHLLPMYQMTDFLWWITEALNGSAVIWNARHLTEIILSPVIQMRITAQ